MGWFRLFDRLRLRPASDAPEGWALPGSTLRLTDPHLAAYFRDLISAAGVSAQADLFDIASHAFARSTIPAPGRFHVDLRCKGPPASLMFGTDSAHAVLAWHQASRVAGLILPKGEVVELLEADLLGLCKHHLNIAEIATLSAWMPDAETTLAWLVNLAPWLTTHSRAVIRLPGSALAGVINSLPSWPFKPVALLPCEPAEVDPASPLPDILLCLEEISRQTTQAATARAHAAARVVRATLWQGESNPAGGVSVSPIAESRTAASGLPIALLGDAPPTAAGAALFGMQRNPMRGWAANAVRIEMQAASLFVRAGCVVAVPLSGPAVFDPDHAADAATVLAAENWLDAEGVAVPRVEAIHTVAARTAVLVGSSASRESFFSTIWPRIALAFELIEREKLSAAQIELVFPQGADAWTRAMVALCGFNPALIRTECEGVLFRRLILSSPACDLAAPRRSDMFDLFWQNLAGFASGGAAASVTLARPSGLVLLLTADSQLLNAAELATLARDRQYRVIDPQTAAPDDLAAILRNARVVVAESRHAIWSALASNAGLGLMQADTDPAIPYAALHVAGARGHQVVAMFGATIGDDASAGYVVASDRLAMMFDRLEASATAGEAA